MDSLRGNFGSTGYDAGQDDYDFSDDETGHDEPPASIGTDERRMQVRAYNHWASLLNDRNFPSIEDLEPEELTDFGPYSVLLDFTSGIEDPAIQYLGGELAVECGTNSEMSQLADVPSRSLLSRITDHYMQIMANQAPIGFEAEFVNQRGATILYRGILLPYSSDSESIDFIYGVINWKEIADQITTDELLLEIDQALDANEPQVDDRSDDPVTEWADGPVTSEGDEADLSASLNSFPEPAFGESAGDELEFAPEADFELDMTVEQIVAPSHDLDHSDWDDNEGELEAGLFDCLAHARELAQHASSSEDRTRQALYAAVGRAYDFSIAAQSAPEEFEELVAANGLTVQERAPMTPVVKLVFGSDYDKTRLTEYAAVLTHAQRVGIERGNLTRFLANAEGGLKAVVNAERRIRKEESGQQVAAADAVKPAIAEKLRKLEGHSLASIDAEGEEFAVVMIHRLPDGEIIVLGEVANDIPLVEKVARKLIC